MVFFLHLFFTFKSLFFYGLYWILPSTRRREEVKTDKLVIEKGYAKELVLSAKRLGRCHSESKDETYMSVERIKAYAKEVGKW